MLSDAFRSGTLVLAIYLLAALLPVLSVTERLAQSDVQHAQMMAMAGHLMPMQDAERGGDDTRMLLCQQHCLLVAAPLPVHTRTADSNVRSSEVVVAADRLATSVVLPPPGPPPKAAVV
jgi:hypothetical protein